MEYIGMRDVGTRQRDTRPSLNDRRRQGNESYPVIVSRVPLSSTISSSASSRRLQATPSVTNNHVLSLKKAIESGQMNISKGNSTDTRLRSRYNQISPERTIRANQTTAYQTIAPTQHKLNLAKTSSTVSPPREFIPHEAVTVYSIKSMPSVTEYMQNDSIVPQAIPTMQRTKHVPLSINESQLRNSGLCGLRNLGNTCFMNSVLQCLSNTKPLLLFCFQDDLDRYLNTSSTSSMKGDLMKEYVHLIRQMWSLTGGQLVIGPVSFKSTVGHFAPRFTGYSEQDSQEFLICLLQGLSEDVNRVQHKPAVLHIDEKQEQRMREEARAKASWDRCLRYENSPLVDIFAGQLKSTLECSYCGYKSITFDMFWDLSLPLPYGRSSTNIQECLQLFTSKEELTGNEEPMCTNCKRKRPCTKKLSIQRCPEILILHLKRFSQMHDRAKLNTHVDFPLTDLKLSHLRNVMSESYGGREPTYNLFGVSSHSGTLYSGHYVARCRHPFTHEWYEFDDASVRLIRDISSIISDDAYVLFYERHNL